MQRDSHSDDWDVSLSNTLTRRRVAALIGAGVAGGGGLYAATGDAQAAVSVDSLTVQDATFEAESADPVLDAVIGWEYQYTGAQELVVELLVGETVVASEQRQATGDSGGGETTLSGRVVDAEAWTLSEFDVQQGETIEREVSVTVRFAVVVNGVVAKEASASKTAVVAVEWPAGEAYATVGGEITFRNAE